MEEITVYCKNNGTYRKYPKGTSLLDVLDDQNVQSPYRIVAALVNNRIESLNFCLYKHKNVEFVDLSSPAGMRVYVLSLIMVFNKAVEDIFPDTTMRVEHPISKGYFCRVHFPDNHQITLPELALIKSRMQELINVNIPFECEEKETEGVARLFRKRGKNENADLLESLGEPFSSYYRLGTTIDYYNGVLVPSTEYLSLFDLLPYFDGVLLQVPDRKTPNVLEKVVPQQKIFEIFHEYLQWSEMTNLKNINDVNAVCEKQGGMGMLIKVFEAFHEKKISKIADQIQQRGNVKMVLIAGPSSSGKTTFSKRLAIQLAVAGIKPFTLSTDDYFVERTETPVDENGKPDFESIYAMDLKLFNRQLRELMEGKEVLMPEFDFVNGTKVFKNKRKIDDNTVIVIEGIHALNPELTKEIDDSLKFKVYVSALTTISLDSHNWISTTDTRLLRRILRDSKYRGYPARKTIAQWPSVQKGEQKWIFPYQENADAMFNSALLFEFSALKSHLEPILMEVPKNCDEYAEAYRLRRFLRYIKPIPDGDIPQTSLLREFLGGSSFMY